MDDFKNHYDCRRLIGQTNLTTTNRCVLKGHCVSAGIICAVLFFPFVPSLPLIQLHSYTSLYAFEQHTNNSTRTFPPHVKADRSTDCGASSGRENKFCILLWMDVFLWLCCILLYSKQDAVHSSISASSTMNSSKYDTKHCRQSVCKVIIKIYNSPEKHHFSDNE